MRSLLPYCLFLGCAWSTLVPADPDEECTYALEVLILQDASASFKAHVDSMSEFIIGLTESLKEDYEELRLGVSSWIDKPVPYRGYGAYGAWGDSMLDWCYASHTPLTDDPEKIKTALTSLGGNLGGGMDLPENPWEALILAAYDKSADWTPPEVTHSPAGRPIVRLALLITDDIPQDVGNAAGMITYNWNWPRSYPDDSMICNLGGFGCHNYVKTTYCINQGTEELVTEYEELADLFALVDHEVVLTPAQEARLDELIELFGPYPFPEVESVHPGDNSLGCGETEYPSLQQTADALNKHKITPLFLLADADNGGGTGTLCRAIGMAAGKECLAKLYEAWSEQMGFDTVSDFIDAENTESKIRESILKMTNLQCLKDKETTELPTTETPTTHVPTTAVPTTELLTTEVLTTEVLTTELLTTKHPKGTTIFLPTDPTESATEIRTTAEPTPTEDKEPTTELLTTKQPKGTTTFFPTDPTELPTTENLSTASPTETDTPLAVTSEIVTTKYPSKHSTIADTESTSEAAVADSSSEVVHKTTQKEVSTTIDRDENSSSAPQSENVHASASASVGAGGSRTELTTASTEDLTGVSDWSSTDVSSTDESGIIIIPPVIPPTDGGNGDGDDEDDNSGPNIGMIAGASAGAVAGLAAGAAAFMKFGGGLMGGGGAEGMEALRQVETPDSPIERETMEQVTMEMFQ